MAEAPDDVAVTDSSGRFHLTGIPISGAKFSVRRIGYRPVTFEIDLLADSTVIVAIRLRSVQMLESVEVTALPYSRKFIATGFEQRQRLGLGTFISPARIDSLRPYLNYTSQLLRNVRGVEVRCTTTGGCVVQARREPKCLNLFVDGAEHRIGLDEMVPLSLVYAIEVYESPSRVPTEFQGRLPRKSSPLTVAAGCGVIAVWTLSRQ